MKQFELLGEDLPGYIVNCVDGGSNFAGLAYPPYYEGLIMKRKGGMKFIIVEPKAAPSRTRSVYA